MLDFLEQRQCKVQELVTDTTRQSPTEPMLFHMVRERLIRLTYTERNTPPRW